jgi:hypothetical protein
LQVICAWYVFLNCDYLLPHWLILISSSIYIFIILWASACAFLGAINTGQSRRISPILPSR